MSQRYRDTLQAIIHVRPQDRDILISKLEKIGIYEKNVTWKLLPNSMLGAYIIEVTQLKLQYCINCDHVEESHDTTDAMHRCYGLDKNGKVCNCIRFIPTQR